MEAVCCLGPRPLRGDWPDAAGSAPPGRCSSRHGPCLLPLVHFESNTDQGKDMGCPGIHFNCSSPKPSLPQACAEHTALRPPTSSKTVPGAGSQGEHRCCETGRAGARLSTEPGPTHPSPAHGENQPGTEGSSRKQRGDSRGVHC